MAPRFIKNRMLLRQINSIFVPRNVIMAGIPNMCAGKTTRFITLIAVEVNEGIIGMNKETRLDIVIITGASIAA